MEARVGIRSTIQVFVRGGVSGCFEPWIPGSTTGFLRKSGWTIRTGQSPTKESISNNASLENNPAIIQSQHKPLTVDGNETSLRTEQVNHVPFSEVLSWSWLAEKLHDILTPMTNEPV
jgi:hypothetical protein